METYTPIGAPAPPGNAASNGSEDAAGTAPCDTSVIPSKDLTGKAMGSPSPFGETSTTIGTESPMAAVEREAPTPDPSGGRRRRPSPRTRRAPAPPLAVGRSRSSYRLDGRRRDE